MLEQSSKDIIQLRAAFLKQRQSLSLESKIRISHMRIKSADIHFDGMLYASISGGVDSTVLLHMARQVVSDIPAVFIDTGLEYPENRGHVKTLDNVVWLRPAMPFHQVIEKYGYPIISKEVSQKVYELKTTKSEKLRDILLHGGRNGNGKLSDCWKFLVNAPFKISDKCCDVMKKRPAKKYEKETRRIPLLGIMADDSRQRKTEYLLSGGCNMFENNRPKSEPLAFWTKADIWEYIHQFNLPYSKAYDMGYTATGCMFCAFGVQREHSDLFAKNKFQMMKTTHPQQYTFCMKKLDMDRVLSYIRVNH